MVIRHLHDSLPAPAGVRIASMILIAAVALVLLHEWMGDTILDSGGTIG